MSSSHFYLARLSNVVIGLICSLIFLLAGCQVHPVQPTTSFAQTPTCTNNAFLQKYNCNVADIEQAAQSGDPDAQYALGYLFYYGVGVQQNQATALVWIRKAAAQDQPLAKQALLIMQKGNPSAPPPMTKNGIEITSSGYTEAPPMQHAGPTPVVTTESPAAETVSVQKPMQPLNSQLPAYNAEGGDAGNNNSSQPALDMLQTSDASNSSITDKMTSSNSSSSADNVIADNRDVVNSKSSSESSHLTADERYLLSLNPLHSTIQLLGSHNLQSILDFTQANKLGHQTNYYKTVSQNRPWYLLVMGEYSSKVQAEAALHQLSPTILAQNPWVRSFAEIQKEIRQQHSL